MLRIRVLHYQKSESTKKIEREATKRAHARQFALMDGSTEEEDGDDESLLEQGVPPRKMSQCKIHPSSTLKKQQTQQSGTVGDDEDTDG